MDKPLRFGWQNDSTGTEIDMLGGKGAGLAMMANKGLPVPSGITIPTTVCREWMATDELLQKAKLREYVKTKVIPKLNELTDHLGETPLYSVRSGAPFSMPGMMDTILNVGMTSESAPYYKDVLGELCALDCKRRLIQMMGSTCYGMKSNIFKGVMNRIKTYKYGLPEYPASEKAVLASLPHLKKVIWYYTNNFETQTGGEVPDTLEDQLVVCIAAVFRSWMSERAIEYREHHNLPDTSGTAVTIQQMVFGNRDEKSCSGVAFTRNYMTGEDEVIGDIVINGQGEDVVAGTHDTLDLDAMKEWDEGAYDQLVATCVTLEEIYKDMMDLEFTVEDGKFWMLQCRVGKRQAKAAFKIAVDLVHDGFIDKATAVERVTYEQYKALHKVRVNGDTPEPDHVGTPAGGGLVVGHVVTTSAEAKAKGAHSPVILVTDETTPEDFGGMKASVGILTRTGGATSHAAVVGRSLEKHCVVGVTDLPDIAGQVITIDGNTGRVWLDELPLTTGGIDEVVNEVVDWALELNGKDVFLKVNCDTVEIDGDYVQVADATSKELEGWLDKVTPTYGKTFYLDIEAPGCDRREEDKALWDMAGKNQTDLMATVSSRLGTLSTADVVPEAVVVYPKGAHEALVKAVSNHGWRVCQRVATLDQLLDSGDIVEVEDDFADHIGGQKVADKLFKVMEAAGKQISSKPTPVSKSRLIAEVLK